MFGFAVGIVKFSFLGKCLRAISSCLPKHLLLVGIARVQLLPTPYRWLYMACMDPVNNSNMIGYVV